MSKNRILVLHGPNLNLLGEREPDVYGTFTLAQINAKIRRFAADNGWGVKVKQTNHEGELIDLLHSNRKWATGIVFNPGAYTHYSYALRDAVTAIQVPTIEVHLSEIKKREKFRRISVIAPACHAQVSGLGWRSYTKAMEILCQATR